MLGFFSTRKDKAAPLDETLSLAGRAKSSFFAPEVLGKEERLNELQEDS